MIVLFGSKFMLSDEIGFANCLFNTVSVQEFHKSLAYRIMSLFFF